MLFGAGGYNQYDNSYQGVRTYGPFLFTQNPRNEPTIVVLCRKSARGRVEQFVTALRDGVEGDDGRFSNGLVGKFRLTGVRIHFVEINSDTGEDYAEAASSALDELTQTPELALVQLSDSHKQVPPSENPYFIVKSRFMRSGVPVQAIRLETIEQENGRIYKLNNLALGSYAKIGGIPWVISTRGVATHELVIGIGSSEIGTSRLSEWTRYIGFTTVFQGDGRYLVWETTREATYEDYPEALLKSLRKSIRFVQMQNRWEIRDDVRLIFHVYKPLKRIEIKAVKQLVEELLIDYSVEFAFLDVSHYHQFQIFDQSQLGVTYGSYGTWGSSPRKGVFVPKRGTAILLGPNLALLQFVGPRDVKHSEQGIPRPLLFELHRDSDFSDLTYLVRQAFHFSFMSWRSFFPSHEPVTILYSRLIANMLGNLKTVPDWDKAALDLMRDRRAMWFL